MGGVVPAGTSKKDRDYKATKRSPLDALADKITASKKINEQAQADVLDSEDIEEYGDDEEDTIMSRHFGSYNVSFSPMVNKWIVRHGIEFSGEFDNYISAANAARSLSGHSEQNDTPEYEINPVDTTTPITTPVDVSASDASYPMDTEAPAIDTSTPSTHVSNLSDPGAGSTDIAIAPPADTPPQDTVAVEPETPAADTGASPEGDIPS